MNDEIARLLADLDAETRRLTEMLDPIAVEDWDTMTPAQPWTITDQVGHLAYFDERATLAATDRVAFADAVNRDAAALSSDVGDLHRSRDLAGPAVLAWFDHSRRAMMEALTGVDPDERIRWYGPPMRPASFVIARLMETWAHGTDVADALGLRLETTDRLFHIADLGVRTFSWSFANRGLDVPEDRVRVALRGRSGTTRIWNDASSGCVTGPVEEFCGVVTQRRNVADTHLVLEGGLAREWMRIAQAFAGPPGPGR